MKDGVFQTRSFVLLRRTVSRKFGGKTAEPGKTSAPERKDGYNNVSGQNTEQNFAGRA